MKIRVNARDNENAEGTESIEKLRRRVADADVEIMNSVKKTVVFNEIALLSAFALLPKALHSGGKLTLGADRKIP